jgi:hypothetical protein
LPPEVSSRAVPNVKISGRKSGNRGLSFMKTRGALHNKSEYQLQPVVLPHVSHFMQVPLRTRVKLPHSLHISPS